MVPDVVTLTFLSSGFWLSMDCFVTVPLFLYSSVALESAQVELIMASPMPLM